MLEEIDLDHIFRTATHNGYTDCEVYGETSIETTLSIQGRMEEARVFRAGGISLRCSEGEKVIQSTLPQRSGISSEPFDDKFAATVPLLSQTMRNLWGENEGLKFPSLRYSTKLKHFEVAHSKTREVKSGSEEIATISVHANVDRRGAPSHIRWERSHHSVEKLLAALREKETLHGWAQDNTRQTNPWPLPSGEIPILWSAVAFSKLCFPLLRGFEGDLLAGNVSFLSELQTPLKFHFSVEDAPDTGVLLYDHEGSMRKNVTLLENGNPQAVACNREIAEQLSVSPTGHCRRESYDSAPTIGLWSPCVRAKNRIPDILRTIAWGLSVHDLDVLKYNPSTADAFIRLRHVFLIHHGEEGELTEPLDLQINLITLLEAAKQFSEESEDTGVIVSKNHTHFVTELSCPAALSDPIPIAGQVPLTHYW